MTVTRPAAPAPPNFRDIGGHRVPGGLRVRRGLLYRSAVPGDPDAGTARWLADLGIRTVFDLRTRTEREHGPSVLPVGAQRIVIDVLADAGEADPGGMFQLLRDPPRASAMLGNDGAQRFFLAAYRDMVRLPRARTAFGDLYRHLADASLRPALLHCMTGKDRTGWAVAVLLTFLGVPSDAVLEDYLRSDAEIRTAYGHIIDDFVARGGDRHVIEPLMGVRTSFLEAAFDEMATLHGSVAVYLEEGLGLDEAVLEALRQAFLEPA